MQSGLQTFDELGNIELDITSQTFKILGEGETGLSDGTLTDSRITADTVVVVTHLDGTHLATGSNTIAFLAALWANPPVITVGAGKISWKFKKPLTYVDVTPKYQMSARFFYGGYV